MGAGSKQVQPQNLQPPDVQGYRTNLSTYLTGILNQIMGAPGTNFAAPTDPLINAVKQQYSGLISGQDMGNGPYGAANRYLTDLISGGENLDVNPLIQRARSNFTDVTAPAIKESLGAQYGIRYGTPVAESVARAGRGANEDLNAQLVGLANQGLQRRAGAAQFGAGLQQDILQGAYGVGGREVDRILQLILGGGSALGIGNFNYQNPQYANNSILPQLLSLGGAGLGAAFGGPAGAAAGYQIGSSVGGYGNYGGKGYE